MNKHRNLWIAGLPVWIGTIIALLMIWRRSNMTPIEWSAVLVALISGVITLIMTLLQLKRDGKTIDNISTTTSNTDTTTSVMKPMVERIDAQVCQTHHTLISTVSHDIAAIGERNSKIDFIHKELEYQQRLNREFSENAVGRDSLLAGINAVYAENARLNQLHRGDQETIIRLIAENGKLQTKVEQLEKALQCERSSSQPPEPCSSGWDLEPEI